MAGCAKTMYMAQLRLYKVSAWYKATGDRLR